MYDSIILPLAKQDVRKAAHWYNKKQKGIGRRFTSHIREKVYLIRQNPFSNNIRYDNVRTAVVNGFPFMIHYTIDEKIKTIIVSAIFHTSRSPEIWKNR